jgi:hypothetical protein
LATALINRSAFSPGFTSHAVTDRTEAGPHSRALIIKWGQLHMVRTALGAAAVVALLMATVVT